MNELAEGSTGDLSFDRIIGGHVESGMLRIVTQRAASTTNDDWTDRLAASR